LAFCDAEAEIFGTEGLQAYLNYKGTDLMQPFSQIPCSCGQLIMMFLWY